MSTLTFRLKKDLAHSINCAALTPENLAGKSIPDIASLMLSNGRSELRVDAVFEISGQPITHGLQSIHFKDSSCKLDYLGAHITSGSLDITGDVGAYLGFNLNGGTIHCHGNSSAFAACNMVKGLLMIDGNTGEFLGGGSAGQRKGMRGGTVLVKGNAGDRAGDQMRRGLILIEGNAGDYCGSRMIAGTIGVMGNVGMYAGFNMKHGTLLLLKKPTVHATMQDCGMHTMPFLSLLYQSFSKLDSQFSRLHSQRVQRWVGDAACNGNGEILLISA
ncbi:MAG: formylmethanofuran dehydrogenase subunit C [Methylophilales bacterium]|jgi:formylmethanofuran dehydrogenase subunit C|nr:formylmethanofuran dehydrogenase subunit C [Methylophilales bacterium]